MTKEARWLLEEKYGGVRSAAFARDLERLAAGEPLAYVIGWQPFLGLKIWLDSHPLIPRPETEWWVEQLLEELEGASAAKNGARTASASGVREPMPAASARRAGMARRVFAPPARASVSAAARRDADAYPFFAAPAPFTFLDLCAGSGAIGCAALARLPQARVYFGELDPAHEATIRKNIRETLGAPWAPAADRDTMIYHSAPAAARAAADRATVGIGDLFAPFRGLTFDAIVANPPYVPEGRALPRSVAAYEPPRALFAGTDGLAVIRRIAAEFPRHLAKNGVALVECDRARASDARALFAAAGFAARIRTDQYGTPRVIVVSWS